MQSIEIEPAPLSATTCEIRMLTTLIELVDSYRLRYEVYEALGYLPGKNQARLDC